MTVVREVDPRTAAEGGRTRLTWWSLLSVVLALPVWWFVAVSGVMTRALDGGIFLSVVGGLQQGLPLYSGVWDNKDPLFFGAMLAAATVSRAGPFVMDWLWIPVGALGAWLVARPLMSGDRALFAGLVAAPLVLTGSYYIPGWASTPGTAVLLLALGLLMSRLGVGAGVVLGLLAFVKLVVWPIGVAALVAMLLVPDVRRVAIRGLIALAATIAGGIGALAALGWAAGYAEALNRNRTYSGAVMTYFGFEDSPLGHLRKMAEEWETVNWLGVVAVLVIALVMTVVLVSRPAWRSPARLVLGLWLWLAVIGTGALLALTYVWPHHAQAVYLPAVLSVIALLAMIPDGWPILVAVAISGVSVWLGAGAGGPVTVIDRFVAARADFSARWADQDDVPTDARLLLMVPQPEFTLARLGSNDDGGFLRDAPSGARLACAQFHLYDFSPPEDFERMLECIKDVDSVLLTDGFVAFGNGGRAASVQPILQYVDYAFDCVRVGDRQLCSREPGL